MNKVYQAYALEFFAPFFHFRYPKDKFKIKPKFLTQPEALLVAIIVNSEYGPMYKLIADDLELSNNVRAHASNMYHLITFFAPQVSVELSLPLIGY